MTEAEHAANLRVALKLLDEARRERDEARQMLGECYALSGADTDGDGWEHNWQDAVREVRTLRKEYDDLKAEMAGLQKLLLDLGTALTSTPFGGWRR